MGIYQKWQNLVVNVAQLPDGQNKGQRAEF